MYFNTDGCSCKYKQKLVITLEGQVEVEYKEKVLFVSDFWTQIELLWAFKQLLML